MGGWIGEEMDRGMGLWVDQGINEQVEGWVQGWMDK